MRCPCIHAAAAVSFIALTACTTERVSTEFGTLSDALSAADAQVTPLLEPSIEAARQAELTISAQRGDAWFLSEGCGDLLGDVVVAPSSSCQVVNLPLGDRPPVQNEATSARRKMDTLSSYVGALELLMDASTDTAITESYAAALSAFADLGAATGSKELIDFVADRQRKSERANVDRFVPPAVATLRYNRMRTVVRDSNVAVATVVRELQLHLLNLGVDKGTAQDPRDLSQRIAELNRLNQGVLSFDTTDENGYREAIVLLQNEHRLFMDFYKNTSVYKVGLVSEVHNALDEALRNPGNVEDVVGYLESLKSLIELVDG